MLLKLFKFYPKNKKVEIAKEFTIPSEYIDHNNKEQREVWSLWWTFSDVQESKAMWIEKCWRMHFEIDKTMSRQNMPIGVLVLQEKVT